MKISGTCARRPHLALFYLSAIVASSTVVPGCRSTSGSGAQSEALSADAERCPIAGDDPILLGQIAHDVEALAAAETAAAVDPCVFARVDQVYSSRRAPAGDLLRIKALLAGSMASQALAHQDVAKRGVRPTAGPADVDRMAQLLRAGLQFSWEEVASLAADPRWSEHPLRMRVYAAIADEYSEPETAAAALAGQIAAQATIAARLEMASAVVMSIIRRGMWFSRQGQAWRRDGAAHGDLGSASEDHGGSRPTVVPQALPHSTIPLEKFGLRLLLGEITDAVVRAGIDRGEAVAVMQNAERAVVEAIDRDGLPIHHVFLQQGDLLIGLNRADVSDIASALILGRSFASQVAIIVRGWEDGIPVFAVAAPNGKGGWHLDDVATYAHNTVIMRHEAPPESLSQVAIAMIQAQSPRRESADSGEATDNPEISIANSSGAFANRAFLAAGGESPFSTLSTRFVLSDAVVTANMRTLGFTSDSEIFLPDLLLSSSRMRYLGLIQSHAQGLTPESADLLFKMNMLFAQKLHTAKVNRADVRDAVVTRAVIGLLRLRAKYVGATMTTNRGPGRATSPSRPEATAPSVVASFGAELDGWFE